MKAVGNSSLNNAATNLIINSVDAQDPYNRP